PVPRRLRRVLRDRSSDEKRARKKVDREYSRKNRWRIRSRASSEDVRPDEVTAHVASVILSESKDVAFWGAQAAGLSVSAASLNNCCSSGSPSKSLSRFVR